MNQEKMKRIDRMNEILTAINLYYKEYVFSPAVG